jgi:hypothetical protein
MPKLNNKLSRVSFKWYLAIILVAFLLYMLAASSKEYMMQDEHFQINKNDKCLRVNAKKGKIQHRNGVVMAECDKDDSFQIWKYAPDSKRIMTTDGNVNYCLDYDGTSFKVTDCFPKAKKDQKNLINRMFTINTLKTSADVTIGIDQSNDCINNIDGKDIKDKQVSCDKQAAKFKVYYV